MDCFLCRTYSPHSCTFFSMVECFLIFTHTYSSNLELVSWPRIFDWNDSLLHQASKIGLFHSFERENYFHVVLSNQLGVSTLFFNAPWILRGIFVISLCFQFYFFVLSLNLLNQDFGLTALLELAVDGKTTFVCCQTAIFGIFQRLS